LERNADKIGESVVQAAGNIYFDFCFSFSHISNQKQIHEQTNYTHGHYRDCCQVPQLHPPTLLNGNFNLKLYTYPCLLFICWSQWSACASGANEVAVINGVIWVGAKCRAEQKGQQWQRRCQEISLKNPPGRKFHLELFMPGNFI
jgi:hypothetical protein